MSHSFPYSNVHSTIDFKHFIHNIQDSTISRGHVHEYMSFADHLFDAVIVRYGATKYESFFSEKLPFDNCLSRNKNDDNMCW